MTDPTIEGEVLHTTLQKKGFAIEDLGIRQHSPRVEEIALDEGSDFIDHSESASSDSSGKS